MAVRGVLALPVNPHLAVGASGACSKHVGLSLVKARGVDILSIVNVARCPIDFLHLLQLLNVPKLQLLLGCIASCKDNSILIVQ